MNKHLIAVVDDESDLLENFQMLLEDQYQVATYHSPNEFLKALPTLHLKGLRILVTDYKMPEMNGLQMVQSAHQQFPKLPFIVLSGYLDKDTVLAAVKMGTFQLLEKPCQPDDLFAAIDQILMETELDGVRSEIRQITSQLRELYVSLRLMLTQYVPEDIAQRLLLENSRNEASQKIGFEDLLESLEKRLEQLLKTESMMGELKSIRVKSN